MTAVVTARQYIALRLYFVEGWSYRRIGGALGISGPSAYELVVRGRNNVLRYCVQEQAPNTSPIVRALLSTDASTSTRDVREAASRQDELLDTLEARVEQRAAECAAIEACMSGNSHLPTHVKRNTFDRWEQIVLNESCRSSLPTSAYEARRLHRFLPILED